MRYAHPEDAFLAEGLDLVPCRSIAGDETSGRFTHLVDYVDFCLTGHADGLDCHNLSLQSPLSDVREPAVGDNFILDPVSGEFTDEITFRDLARGSSKFPQ